MNQPGETRARGFGREPSGDWRHRAACRGLADTYFDPWDSDDTDTEPNATAMQFCSTCPVRRACLIEAITHGEPHGTWGGLTQKQRRNLVRARRRVRCPVCGGKLLGTPDQYTQACLSCGITWRMIRRPETPERSQGA